MACFYLAYGAFNGGEDTFAVTDSSLPLPPRDSLQID